jgi:hypothetical protein
MTDDIPELRAALAAVSAKTVSQNAVDLYKAAANPDRIARLLDRLEAAEREAASWEKQASDRLDDALRFAAERDAAERDAARWRAARLRASYGLDDGAGHGMLTFDPLPWPNACLPNTSDYADAAIDAAMQHTEGEPLPPPPAE